MTSAFPLPQIKFDSIALAHKLAACRLPIYKFTFCLFVSLVLAGCESGSYYYQVAEGHMKIMAARQPISELISDNSLPTKERTQLEKVMEIRTYATEELHLPVEDHYSEYVDLGRPHVVWNVVATPPLSMTPKKWCFPIAGCVNYKGYFTEEDARAYAQTLNDNNFDTYVGGVAAYSTLGWFDDPVLNTFLFRGDASLAALLFHELSHKLLYIKGDSVFNESFATTVEIEGLSRWLETQSKGEYLDRHLAKKKRHQEFISLILEHRTRRIALYKSDLSDKDKLVEKRKLITSLREEYEHLRDSVWKGYSGYNKWFDGPLNNAQLSTIATYNALVHGLQALLANNDHNLAEFYQRCTELAQLDKKARHSYLKNLVK